METVETVSLNMNDIINKIIELTADNLKNSNVCKKIMESTYKRLPQDKIINILHDLLKHNCYSVFSEFTQSLYENERGPVYNQKEYTIQILNDCMRNVIIRWVFVDYEVYLEEQKNLKKQTTEEFNTEKS